MPKDRDVWDPPEDVKPMETPLSAFKQHFQDRAVLVGRDGTNAQLVRLKHLKPIHWTREKDKSESEAASHLPIKKAVPPIRRKGSLRGIHAPDEVSPAVWRPPPRSGALLSHSSPNTKVHVHPLRGDGVSDAALSAPTRLDLSPITEGPSSSSSAANAFRLGNAHTHPKRHHRSPRSPLSPTRPCTPEILSIEAVGREWTGTAPPRADASLWAEREVAARLPITRLPPRRLSGAADLLPKPREVPTALEPTRNGETPRTEEEVVPMYKPIGLLLPNYAGRGRCPPRAPSAQTKRPSPSGPRIGPRPVTDDAARARDTHETKRNGARPAHTLTGVDARNVSPPLSRLTPMSGLHGETSPPNDTHSTSDTTERSEGHKRPITYKPHTLEEYRHVMEAVANMKRGGLGPADTDAQREAKERMTRQKAYGTRVERQTAEELQKKLQQQQQQQDEDGEAEQEERGLRHPVTIKQPPPLERIQAKERRQRALAYARNVPKPEMVGSKSNTAEESNDLGTSPVRRKPRDEAAWQREKHIHDLEAKHQSDREALAFVKRQLGL